MITLSGISRELYLLSIADVSPTPPPISPGLHQEFYVSFHQSGSMLWSSLHFPIGICSLL